jgi:hypothetical protein
VTRPRFPPEARPHVNRTYSVRPMLADVRIDDLRDALAWPRTRNGPGGITTAVRLGARLWRIIRLERGDPDHGEAVPAEEVASASPRSSARAPVRASRTGDRLC